MNRRAMRWAAACVAWCAAIGLVAASWAAPQEKSPTPAAAAAKDTPAAPAAKDTPAAAPAAKDAPKRPAGPKAAEFQAAFDQWKAVLKKLRALRDQYATTVPEKQPALEEQYNQLVAEGTAMVPKLSAAAEAAYLEAPNEDPELVDFLVGVVMENCSAEAFRRSRDNYEEAYRIAKLMLDKKCEHRTLPAYAGIAAVCVNDYDNAEAWLGQARKSGELERIGQESGNAANNYLDHIARLRSAWKKEAVVREAEAKADDLPRVLLKTSKGDIELELFENEAPNTVANFIALVEKGFYKDVVFHRVLPRFMAQGGDPTGTGSGGPGYEIDCECTRPDYRQHFRGTISMAHAGPNTGGSQFFLTFVPTSFLDGRHTAFGRVIKGFDVLGKLQLNDPSKKSPGAEVTLDKIVEAKVLRKRDHAYTPKTHASSRPPR